MTVAVYFLDRDEYRRRDDARHEAHKTWRSAHPDVDISQGWPAELQALNNSFIGPGAMYECWWIFDPKNPEDQQKREHYLSQPDSFFDPSNTSRGYLSPYYWRQWSHIRPPLNVLCPNGDHWIIDQVSSNGMGWQVTGDPPLITAAPSIQTGRYHGFLQNGVFTADCERPHAPNGVRYDGMPA
jgi:hypothetical protein